MKTNCVREKRKRAKQPRGEQELEPYMESLPSLGDDTDPLVFWVEQKDFYPLLSALAADTKSIPGSSVPVERIFSTAGEATTGKHNRLSHKNLEREVLVRKNQNICILHNERTTCTLITVYVCACFMCLDLSQ